MSDITFMGQPQRRILRREPLGVVGAITPWNFPLYLNLAKLGPALAAGCTIVLKPAPDTPWSATVVGRLIAEKTEIPAGVVNIVASSDHALGEMLACGPARRPGITFTGSTATGRRVMEVASRTVKKVFLELGGKSANVILDDADAGAFGAGILTCTHGGQGCAITTRMLVPRRRYDEALGILEAAFRGAKLRRSRRIPACYRGRRSRSDNSSACSPTSRKAKRKARASSSAAADRRICRRASTSSRRCSPTSTRMPRSRKKRSSARCSA